MTGGHFALALSAWLVLAGAATAQLGGDMPSAPPPTTATTTTAPSASRVPPPPPTAAKPSKRAIDPKKRPNDVYTPTNGSFDFYKLQVYWPSSIFKPQQ